MNAQVAEKAAIAAMDNQTLGFAVDLFSALAHPTRLRIVELLADGSRTVNDVAQTLNILQPNASQHLAVLSRAGVVKVTPVGAMRNYSLVGPKIPRLRTMIDEVRSAQER